MALQLGITNGQTSNRSISSGIPNGGPPPPAPGNANAELDTMITVEVTAARKKDFIVTLLF
jgi:hypothetical protein